MDKLWPDRDRYSKDLALWDVAQTLPRGGFLERILAAWLKYRLECSLTALKRIGLGELELKGRFLERLWPDASFLRRCREQAGFAVRCFYLAGA